MSKVFSVENYNGFAIFWVVEGDTARLHADSEEVKYGGNPLQISTLGHHVLSYMREEEAHMKTQINKRNAALKAIDEHYGL